MIRNFYTLATIYLIESKKQKDRSHTESGKLVCAINKERLKIKAKLYCYEKTNSKDT